MRKLFIVFLIIFVSFGCSKKDEFTSLLENMSVQEYKSNSEYLNCELNIDQINNQLYRYRIVINQPKDNLDHIRAFVVCDKAAENTIPSIGFSENDNCNLYIDKIDIENNFYEGISLMGLANEADIECQLYLSYQIDNQTYQEYIVLRGK